MLLALLSFSMSFANSKLLRPLMVLLVILVIAATGAAFAVAEGGATDGANAGDVQYSQKPGCGPDKTEGVAGGSGQHEGQPPKEPERQDCPEPPGQNQ